MRTRVSRPWHNHKALVVAAGLCALVGCQQVADETPAEPVTAANAAETPPPQSYPPLQSVPPRPRLSYDVQQQREIVEALVADRENARYTSQVIRYRSGLSALPPPPEPPEQVALADPVPVPVQTVAPEPTLTDEETLVDFLSSLHDRFFGDEPEPDVEGADDAAPLAPAEGAAPQDAGQEPAGIIKAAAPAEAPIPPARSAVAARMATHPPLIDDLLDADVAQVPLPPEQAAMAARQGASDAIDTAQAPVPALRPADPRTTRVALPSARPLVLTPPPTKPVIPIRAPGLPRPAADRSATLLPAERSDGTTLAGDTMHAIPTNGAS